MRGLTQEPIREVETDKHPRRRQRPARRNFEQTWRDEKGHLRGEDAPRPSKHVFRPALGDQQVSANDQIQIRGRGDSKGWRYIEMTLGSIVCILLTLAVLAFMAVA